MKVKRQMLDKRKRREVLARAAEALGLLKQFVEEYRKHNVEVLELETGEKVYIVDKVPLLVEVGDGRIVPCLVAVHRYGIKFGLPKVVVDMGAVPHILNGADVMRPGIVRIEGEFGKDSLVFVVDEKYGKEIAVCVALYSSGEIASLKRGKVLKNLHYINDRVWKVVTEVVR